MIPEMHHTVPFLFQGGTYSGFLVHKGSLLRISGLTGADYSGFGPHFLKKLVQK